MRISSVPSRAPGRFPLYARAKTRRPERLGRVQAPRKGLVYSTWAEIILFRTHYCNCRGSQHAAGFRPSRSPTRHTTHDTDSSHTPSTLLRHTLIDVPCEHTVRYPRCARSVWTVLARDCGLTTLLVRCTPLDTRHTAHSNDTLELEVEPVRRSSTRTLNARSTSLTEIYVTTETSRVGRCLAFARLSQARVPLMAHGGSLSGHTRQRKSRGSPRMRKVWGCHQAS
jgi:hypothetical protein